MSTQDFLARTAFNDLANSIEQALSNTEGFRDEAENFADLARRGIRLVPPGVVANLSSFPANPEGGDALFVESEDQIYFFDSDSSTWKDSKIIGSAIFANIQGDPSDNTALQTALDGKADVEIGSSTPFYAGDGISAITHDIQNLIYVAINGWCFFTLQLRTSSYTAGNGVIEIQGLPFVSDDTARGGCYVTRSRRFGAGHTAQVTWWINGNKISIYTNSPDSINFDLADETFLSDNDNFLQLNGFYKIELS